MGFLICVGILQSNKVQPADSSMAGTIYKQAWLRSWKIKWTTQFEEENVIVGSGTPYSQQLPRKIDAD